MRCADFAPHSVLLNYGGINDHLCYKPTKTQSYLGRLDRDDMYRTTPPCSRVRSASFHRLAASNRGFLLLTKSPQTDNLLAPLIHLPLRRGFTRPEERYFCFKSRKPKNPFLYFVGVIAEKRPNTPGVRAGELGVSPQLRKTHDLHCIRAFDAMSCEP